MSDFLILGATGTNGSRLMPLLADAGHVVRAATRRPYSDGFPDGVVTVAFDWEDPSSWPTALAGAQGVFLVAPALKLDPADAMVAFVRQAATAGVEAGAASAAFGVPADYAEFLAERFDVIRAGEDAYTSDGVQQALGREPTSLRSALARELAPVVSGAAAR